MVRACPGEEILQCYNCGKLDDKENLLKCSRCKVVSYCNDTCQLAHWPDHKKICKHNMKERKANKGNREYRLFAEWIGKGVAPSSIYCYYYYQNREYLKRDQIDQDKEVFQFEIAFDFNRLAFIPISPASVVPFEDLSERQLYMVRRLKAPAAIIKFKSYEMALQLSYHCKLAGDDESKYIRRHMTDEQLVRSMVDSMFGYTVHLSSSLLDKWRTDIRIKRNSNVLKSTEQAIQNRFCSDFLLNALYLTSKKPRHTSHVVCIYLSLGTELGEVTALEDFRVHPISSMLWNEENRDNLTANEVMDDDGIPFYRIPVVFLTRIPITKLMIASTIIAKSHVKKVWSANKQHKCDNAAIAAFEEMKKIELLQVESPDLNQ